MTPARGHLFGSGKRVLRQWHRPYRPPDSHLMLAAVTQGGPTSTSRLPQHVCAPRTPFLIRGARDRWSKLSRPHSCQGRGIHLCPVVRGAPRRGQTRSSSLNSHPDDGNALRRIGHPLLPTNASSPTSRPAITPPRIQTTGDTQDHRDSPTATNGGFCARPLRGPARHPGSCAPAPREPDQRHGQDPIPLPAHRGRAEHVHPDAKRLHRGRGPSVPACGRPSPAPRPGSP